MFKPIDTIRSPKGLTLIEVVIAMSIGVIGAMGGYALIAGVQGTIAGNAEVVQAQQDARIIVERIARELRESSPDKVWPAYMTYEDSYYIVFLTPRDANRKFMVDSNGKPDWQRAILYKLEPGSNELYRYQVYIAGESEPWETFQSEMVSKNVERLLFRRLGNDMVTISIRTFSDQSIKTGSVASSYADFYTMVKLRN